MAVNFQQVLGVHAQALQVRAERTQMLAANLAHASTPGYQARDLDFSSAMAALEGGMASAEAGGAALLSGSREALYRVPHHPSRDGNTVEVGVEQALFSQNASDFQMSLTFLNMQLRGLQAAIKGE